MGNLGLFGFSRKGDIASSLLFWDSCDTYSFPVGVTTTGSVTTDIINNMRIIQNGVYKSPNFMLGTAGIVIVLDFINLDNRALSGIELILRKEDGTQILMLAFQDDGNLVIYPRSGGAVSAGGSSGGTQIGFRYKCIFRISPTNNLLASCLNINGSQGNLLNTWNDPGSALSSDSNVNFNLTSRGTRHGGFTNISVTH